MTLPLLIRFMVDCEILTPEEAETVFETGELPSDIISRLMQAHLTQQN